MQDFLSEYQIELTQGGKKIEVAEVGYERYIFNGMVISYEYEEGMLV